MSDPRAVRLAELRAELLALRQEIRETTAPLSPERDALLERYEPLLGQVVALSEELGIGEG
ncbi:hypothetical protein [Vulcanococcus limneticus]|uniref:hypothetical protein n=1 Tax=Vulcanococcus limneticus TaxID=2170428 RepID=UPI00398C1023